MSGVYANWVKVQHPFMSNDIPQMKSDELQPKFYFGGSQVPVNLGINNTNEEGDYTIKIKRIRQGQGLKRQITDVSHKGKILLPRRI